MSKLAIFLCAVLFASVANASSWSDKLEAVQEKVAQAIEATINKVQDTLAAIQVKAEDIMANLLEVATNANEKVQEKIKEILGKIEKEIAEITGKADGVNVTECTELFSHLEHTGLAVISNMSVCVADKLETGTEYIESMVKLSNEVVANLAEVREEAFHCGDDVHDVTTAAAAIVCVNKAAAKATWITTKVVPELSIKLAKLNILLGTLQPSLAYCTANNGLVTFYEESGTIVERTKKCVQQKIDEVRGTDHEDNNEDHEDNNEDHEDNNEDHEDNNKDHEDNNKDHEE